MFSKPIIKPPIEIHEVSQTAEDERRLKDLVPIKRLVNITVESNYYETESTQVKITDYVATRLTSRALDIQIEFQHPEALTLSKAEPDMLRVEFTMGEIFMSENDFSQMGNEIDSVI